MNLEQELEATIAAAGRHARGDEEPVAVIATEPASGTRVYVIAFAAGGDLAYIALDGSGAPVSDRRVVRARRPDVIITTTAFSAREDGNFVLDEADAPILQALQVGSPRAAWTASRPRSASWSPLRATTSTPLGLRACRSLHSRRSS